MFGVQDVSPAMFRQRVREGRIDAAAVGWMPLHSSRPVILPVLDFTLTFRHRADAVDPDADTPELCALFSEPKALIVWLAEWRVCLDLEDPARAAVAANPEERVTRTFVGT